MIGRATARMPEPGTSDEPALYTGMEGLADGTGFAGCAAGAGCEISGVEWVGAGGAT